MIICPLKVTSYKSLDSAVASTELSINPISGSKANIKSPTFKSPVTSYCSRSKLRTFLILESSVSINAAWSSNLSPSISGTETSPVLESLLP